MIKLVKIQESDLETLMKWRMLPKITRCMYTEPQLTIEMQYKWFDAIRKDPTCKHWIIEFEETKIGTVYLTNIDFQNCRCTWGYYIGDTSIKIGFSKILALEYNIYDFVFDELRLNKLIGEVLAFNEAVVKLHERCGSKIEGVLRQHIKKGDIYYDVVTVGMLRDEWLERRAKINYEKINIETV